MSLLLFLTSLVASSGAFSVTHIYFNSDAFIDIIQYSLGGVYINANSSKHNKLSPPIFFASVSLE